jgi:tetratricopeptide (TPR) repeat protein
MRLLTLAAALALPLSAFAAGSDDPQPPKPTNTTKTCKGVKVWDDRKGRCVRPKNSSLGQDGLYGAVRELAYAGRYEDAQGVLLAMDDQQDSRVLTYWGFTHRKLGDQDQAQAYYTQAIARDPDNFLARSYMGQGFAAEGKPAQALAQWKEIRARGGTGTWAEASLRAALETGVNSSY